MAEQTPPDPQALNALAAALVKMADAQTIVTEGVTKMAEGMGDVFQKLEKTVGGMERLVDTIGKARREVGGIGKGVGDFVSSVEGVRGVMKSLLTASSQLRINMKNGTATVEDAKKAHEAMLGVLNKTLKKSKENSEQWHITTRAIAGVEEVLKRIGAEQGRGNSKLKDNVKLTDVITKNMKNMELAGGKIAGAFNNMGLGKVHKTILDINSALGRSGRIEQSLLAAKRLRNVKEERRARRRNEGRTAQPRDLKEGFKARRLKEGSLTDENNWTSFFKQKGFKSKDLLDSTGALDMSKLSGKEGKKAREAMMDFFFNPASGGKKQKGLAGRLNERLARSSMKKGNAAGLGEALEQNGLLEGGLGLLGDLSVAGANPLAIGLTAKDVWDAGASQNQKFESALGKGGVFSGATGGVGGLNNARDNLRAWGLNRFRISQERNLAVAQTMQESGISLSGLAKKGTGMQVSGVGDIASIAMKQAREIGLTDVEGTKQTIKMLQNYKMTLDGVQTFFRTVGKDITAAGLSTGKYLELIDDIEGQFDSMGKSIENVTDILRAMGNTGTETAEQMKENFTALLGKPQTDEQSLFGMSMMSEPAYRKAVTATQKDAKVAIQNYMDSIGTAISHANLPQGSYEAIWKGLDLTKPKDLDTAQYRWEDMARKNGVDPGLFTTQIGPTELTAKNAVAKAQYYKRGRYYAAGAQGVTDDTVTSRITSTMNDLSNALEASGSSTDDLVENGVAGINDPLLFKKTYELMGGDPHKVQQITKGVGDISDTIVDELGNGLSAAATKGMSKGDIDALYAKHLADIGYVEGKDYTKGTAQGVYQSMYRTDSGDLKFKSHKALMRRGALSEAETDEIVNKSLKDHHKETIEQQEKNTAGLAEATTTTNSLLTDIKEALLGKVDGTLTQILNILQPWADLKGQGGTVKGTKEEVTDDWTWIKKKASDVGGWAGGENGKFSDWLTSMVSKSEASNNPRLKAYWDVDHYSIGYGTRAKSPDETITPQEAAQRRDDAIAAARKDVLANVKGQIPKNLMDALVDLDYNVGAAKFANSKHLLNDVNSGHWGGAANDLLDFDKIRKNGGAQIDPGLLARRQQERLWALQSIIPASAPPNPHNGSVYNYQTNTWIMGSQKDASPTPHAPKTPSGERVQGGKPPIVTHPTPTSNQQGG